MFAKIVSLAVAVVAVVVSADHKVPVTVYYESLCPDSIAFVTNQLVPAYNTPLKDHMDLQLVPYGKASHQRTPDGHRWEFRCHHGPVECYGNKVQSCVLKQVRAQDDQLRYVDCLMRQARTLRNEYPLAPCVPAPDLGPVTACANGTVAHPNGNDLLADNGDLTASLAPPLTSVPTVVFNHVFNKTDSDLAQTDFRRALCAYLGDDRPKDCAAASAATTPAAAATALALALAALRLP